MYPTSARRKSQLANGIRTVSSKHVCGVPDEEDAKGCRAGTSFRFNNPDGPLSSGSGTHKGIVISLAAKHPRRVAFRNGLSGILHSFRLWISDGVRKWQMGDEVGRGGGAMEEEGEVRGEGYDGPLFGICNLKSSLSRPR